jgi:glycosyltransferase involved in cell wall biosynthesis
MPQRLKRQTQIVDWLEGPTHPHAEPSTEAERATFRWIQAHVAHRAAVTRFTAQTYWEDYGLMTDAIIPAGVDTRHYVPGARHSNPQPTVLFIGHLVERKNPYLVVDAAARFPNARFVLVGAARDAFGARLLQRVNDLRLPNLTIRPPVGRDALRDQMQASDILMHPSLNEGSPKVVSEAGATGLPAIMFSHYQSPAVVDGVTGFQVENDAEMLDKLEILINDRSLREQMGEAAVLHARQFDWDVVTADWQKLLLEILNAPEGHS